MDDLNIACWLVRPASCLLFLCLTVGCERPLAYSPPPSREVAKEIRASLLASSSGSDVAVGGADQSMGSGWGTLKGKFLFNGTPPTPKALLVNKDTQICAPGEHPVFSESLLIDPATKGIANVVIFLRKANRVHESAQGEGGNVLFDQEKCVFKTHILPMTVGETMEIKNSDPIGHNTKIDGKAGNAFNQTIPADENFLFRPRAEESLPISVSCSIHPWMQAYLLPRKDGYVGVTDEDGTFEIANLPAGEELEFQVWHESAKGPGGGLVLETPESKKLNWSKRGRFKLTLGPDQTEEIVLNVPEGVLQQ